MKALVIEHDALSRPEHIGVHLERRGVDLEHFVVVEDIDVPEVTVRFPDRGHDLLVLMGAPWSIYAPEVQGWVQPELELIRTHLNRGAPVLGVCFGAQAVSLASGGSVEHSSHPEYGWTTVTSSVEELSEGPWFQFHHDDFTLPEGASSVAHNAAGLQAFRLGKSLCIQFHPEVTGELLASWCDAGGDRTLRSSGIDPDELIKETAMRSPQARAALESMLDWWLDGLDQG